MTQIKQPMKAAKLITFIALGCAMLVSLMGCPKRDPTMTPVTLTSIKDATLYEDATGALSNGAGPNMFAGSKGGCQLYVAWWRSTSQERCPQE